MFNAAVAITHMNSKKRYIFFTLDHYNLALKADKQPLKLSCRRNISEEIQLRLFIAAFSMQEHQPR